VARLIWSEGRILNAVSQEMRRRGRRAATAVTRQVKARLALPYPPASRPGQPPRRRTGRLLRSVRSFTETSTGHGIRVSVAVTARSRRGAPYPIFLQYGTRRMLPRPILRPEDMSLILDILLGRR